MTTHSVTEARVTGTRKCPMLMNCKASMIPLVLGQRPVMYQREHSWVMTRWWPVMVMSLRSLKSPYSLMRLSFKAFRPYLRPCQLLMGPLMLRYRLLSGKALQKPPLKTGPSYGEPPGPYVAGYTLSGRQWLVQRKIPRTKPNY